MSVPWRTSVFQKEQKGGFDKIFAPLKPSELFSGFEVISFYNFQLQEQNIVDMYWNIYIHSDLINDQGKGNIEVLK